MNQFGNKVTQEVSLFTEPWRGSLSIYVNAGGVDLGLNNILFRAYAKTGGVRAMVRQFLYLERFPNVSPNMNNQGDSQRGKRDVLVGRVTGVECDEIEVVVLSTLTVNPAAKPDQFVVNYELRGMTDPVGAVDHSFARFRSWPLVPPAGPLETTKFQLTNIGGTLHQLWAVNRAATDVWLYLFDNGPGNPFFSGAIPNGEYPRVPAMYVPPNAKGVLSLDWRPAPLEALFGFFAVASSSGSTFTYDATANLAVGAQIS